MISLFKKKKNPKSLKGVLKQLKTMESNISNLSEKLDSLEKKNKFSVQKIGITRYNPFSDIGGNQSFSIALLDDNNDGLIITSLYSKGGNRVYSKPVKKGNSEYDLSGEEKKSIEKAQEKS